MMVYSFTTSAFILSVSNLYKELGKLRDEKAKVKDGRKFVHMA